MANTDTKMMSAVLKWGGLVIVALLAYYAFRMVWPM